MPLMLLLNVDELPGFVFAFRLCSVLLNVDMLPRRLRLRWWFSREDGGEGGSGSGRRAADERVMRVL